MGDLSASKTPRTENAAGDTPSQGESVPKAAAEVRVAHLTPDLVAQSPAPPRPVQPVPPPPAHRLQMKREAIGYDLSSRERAPTGTGSRFPRCAAKPPLGATMGHGLCTADQELYFPMAGSRQA